MICGVSVGLMELYSDRIYDGDDIERRRWEDEETDELSIFFSSFIFES